MTIPERVKDILEEIANQNFHWNYNPSCHCPYCLATEALKIIAEGGKNSSPTPGALLCGDPRLRWKRVIIDGKDGFIKVEFEKPSYENENPFNDGYGP